MHIEVLYRIFVVGALVFLAASSDDIELPSVNLWEISFDIVSSPEIQAQLEITSDQLRQINNMRSRKDLAELINAKAMKIAAIEFDKRPANNHRVFFELDETIKRELSIILRPDQMDKLRPTKMRLKFKTGYSCFMDPEVLYGCELSKEQVIHLGKEVDLASKAFRDKLDESLDVRVQEIVKLLPTECHDSFVQYAGNKFFPHILPSYDIKLEEIPFPRHFKSVSSFWMASEYEPYKQEARISTEQIRQINVLKKECDYELYRNQSNYKSMRLFMQAMDVKAFEGLRNVLTNDQLLCLGRAQAFGSISMDPIATLTRDEVVLFLKIPRADINAIRLIAKFETEEHEARMEERNCQDFERLLKSVPQGAQVKLRRLFAGVWAK